MNTDNFPTPGDWHDPALATTAEQVRPIVAAGKARPLALEIVRVCLLAFNAPRAQERIQQERDTWLIRALAALWQWHFRALDIDTGREQERPASERLTLLDVAGAADRIASIAWCLARTGERIPLERWIVFDLAVALRRACGCDAFPIGFVRIAESNPENAYDQHNGMRIREHHDHTARTLLPLLIRDVRAMLAAAKVDGSAIEAAIVAHGGTPS